MEPAGSVMSGKGEDGKPGWIDTEPGVPGDTLPDPEQRFRTGGMISPGNA